MTLRVISTTDSEFAKPPAHMETEISFTIGEVQY